MRFTFFLLIMVWGKSAYAHWGHVAEAAGHTHWIGLAAAGIAAGIAIWIGSSASDDEEREEDDSADEPQEA